MSSRKPAYHHVIEPSDWPCSVSQIAHNLFQPLPSCLATIPSSAVSARATAMLRELNADISSNPAICEDSDEYNVHSKLRGILDTLLSTSAALRQRRAAYNFGEAASTVPLWYQLMKALSMTCCEDVYILGETPFILPRTALIDTHDNFRLDGIATMLVCHIVDKVERQSPASPMDVDDAVLDARSVSSIQMEDRDCSGNPAVLIRNDTHSQHMSTEFAGTDCTSDSDAKPRSYYSAIPDRPDPEEFDGSDCWGSYVDDESGSSTALSSGSSIKVSFDAHVLPGHGRRYFAALPLICVADADNISLVISSVLYQRRVWGINEPVVGIFISKTGAIAHVLLGWLDSEDLGSEDNDFLPVPHIACGGGYKPYPAQGRFDLADPVHMLQFAQFVLSLESSFEGIINGSRSPQIQELSWRCDGAPSVASHEDEECDRVKEWLRSVPPDSEESSDSSTDSSEPYTPSSKSFDDASITIVFDMPRKSALESSSSSTKAASDIPRFVTVPDDGSPASIVEVGDENVDEKTKESAVAKASSSKGSAPKPKSAISSSSLGNRPNRGLLESLTISTWLFERGVLLIARAMMPGLSKEEIEINAMVELYNKMTAFVWPATWNAPGNLPDTDLCLDSVKACLFDTKKNCRSEVATLSEDLTMIMESRLSALLYSSASSCRRLLQFKSPGGLPLNEGECRLDWDNVALHFFVNNVEDAISSNVFLERSIKYSRNFALDQEDKDPSTAKFLKDLAWENRTLAIDQSGIINHARDSPADSVKAAIAAVYRADNFLTQLNLVDDDSLTEFTRRHAFPEPRTGICDGLFAVPIKSSNIGPPSEEDSNMIRKYGFVARPEKQSADRKQSNMPMVDPEPDATEPAPAKAKARAKATAKADKNLEEVITMADPNPDTTEVASAKTEKSAAKVKADENPEEVDAFLTFTVASKDNEKKAEKKNEKKTEIKRVPIPKNGHVDFSEDPHATRAAHIAGMPPEPDILDHPLYDAFECLEIPEYVRSSESFRTSDLQVPIFIKEYKKQNDTATKALNQARCYGVSAADFNHRIGLEGYPVFCLATSGTAGCVLLTWYSTCSDKTFIIERNIPHFRLDNPFDAFRYATFLLRLRKETDRRLRESQYNFNKFRTAVTANKMNWTKEMQVAGLPA
ncbi:hypothetical protein A0H81_12700 [Grifola frondosa]|uniref:Uncharacterized protein n=1 Tax=Grifola frondosa TaxID=5627 RepID=A0A1C7LXI1_GRIFR|nr:hypothetical protein A0H81_12700 [Grifola frondosa]